jgi:hypothetical protein
LLLLLGIPNLLMVTDSTVQLVYNSFTSICLGQLLYLSQHEGAAGHNGAASEERANCKRRI